jgi:dTDP-4-amino-4,6-dideoxygalactose transaminase
MLLGVTQQVDLIRVFLRRFNYRITNLRVALGLAQLERIGEFLECRAQIMSW